MTYSIIEDNKEQDLEKFLHSVNAIDLVEFFKDEEMGIDDLISCDLNDLIQLGLPSDRAQQFHEDLTKETKRKNELFATLKYFNSEKLYDELVKIGCTSKDVYSMDHGDLKKIGLSFMERKEVLTKIKTICDADEKERKAQVAKEKIEGTLFWSCNLIDDVNVIICTNQIYFILYISELLSEDENGWTKLFTAAYNNRLAEVKEYLNSAKDLGILSTLIDKAKNDGCTPLWAASSYGYLEVVEVLVKNGAMIDKAKNDGATPLFAASTEGHLKVVEHLLQKGAKIDKATNDEQTPLMRASYEGHLDIVNVLLKHKSDNNLKTKYGKRALDWARIKGHTTIMKTLEQHLR